MEIIQRSHKFPQSETLSTASDLLNEIKASQSQHLFHANLSRHKQTPPTITPNSGAVSGCQVCQRHFAEGFEYVLVPLQADEMVEEIEEHDHILNYGAARRDLDSDGGRAEGRSHLRRPRV